MVANGLAADAVAIAVEMWAITQVALVDGVGQVRLKDDQKGLD